MFREGDGVEVAAGVLGGADEAEIVIALRFADDDGGERDDSAALLCDREHEGGVVELAEDEGVEALGIEPGVDGLADGGVVGGEEHGRAVEGAGESAAGALGEGGCREE